MWVHFFGPTSIEFKLDRFAGPSHLQSHSANLSHLRRRRLHPSAMSKRGSAREKSATLCDIRRYLEQGKGLRKGDDLSLAISRAHSKAFM